MKLKTLVLDEVMAIREGVVSVLNRINDVEVVTVCDKPEEALSEVAKRSYNLALIDLDLGQQNGILLGRQLLRLNPNLKVVIYTKEPSVVIAAEVYRHEYLNPVFKNNVVSITGNSKEPPPGSISGLSVGLHGYTLLQNITPAIFERNLATLRHHGSFMDGEILEILMERLKRYRLTPRELQCSEMISFGKSNREISEELGITRQAVENLINNLYHKLSIAGEPKDPGRRVLLALTMHQWRGLDRNIS